MKVGEYTIEENVVAYLKRHREFCESVAEDHEKYGYDGRSWRKAAELTAKAIEMAEELERFRKGGISDSPSDRWARAPGLRED